MNVELTVPERQQLRQLQKQRRDEAGYVKVTVILLLDKGRPLATIADDLGLDEATVYRYVRAFGTLGVDHSWLTSSRATGVCSPAPSWRTCASRSTRRFTRTVSTCGTGCCARTGCSIRARA